MNRVDKALCAELFEVFFSSQAYIEIDKGLLLFSMYTLKDMISNHYEYDVDFSFFAV